MDLPQELATRLLDALPDGVALLDARQDALPVTYANHALELLRGLSRDELTRLDVARFAAEAEEPITTDELRYRLLRGEVVRLRGLVERPGGLPVRTDSTLQPLRDAAGAVTHVLVLQRVAAGFGAPQAGESRSLPREDRLTGLCHAEYFHELFRRDFAIAQRESRSVAVFVADIDALGLYNDTFGRQAGDSVIRRVGRALLAGLRRNSDLVARLDAGRFVGLAVGMTPEQARRHADTLAARVRELHVHHPRSAVARFVTVSIGIAAGVPARDATPEALLAAAERALAEARSAGRNRVAEALQG